MKRNALLGDVSRTVTSGALFQRLSAQQIRAMLDRATRNSYRTRHWLYTQGIEAREFFFLESGLVKLTEKMPSGHEALIRLIVPGQTFGYFGLVGGANVASAQVARPSTILSWDRKSALELLRNIPAAATNLFAITVQDVAYFYERVHQLRVQSVEERVRGALGELMRAAGRPTQGGILIEYPSWQGDLSELASTTTFAVSRELGKLQRAGVLDKERGKIVVKDPSALPKYPVLNRAK